LAHFAGKGEEANDGRDPATPASSRIRAALDIFDLAREALDLDIETRVSAFELAGEKSAVINLQSRLQNRL
jgi:hypothetical protein